MARRNGKSLIVIAGAVLVTGAALQSRAAAVVGTGCFTAKARCEEGVFGGSFMGGFATGSANCGCELADGTTFGTSECTLTWGQTARETGGGE